MAKKAPQTKKSKAKASCPKKNCISKIIKNTPKKKGIKDGFLRDEKTDFTPLYKAHKK